MRWTFRPLPDFDPHPRRHTRKVAPSHASPTRLLVDNIINNTLSFNFANPGERLSLMTVGHVSLSFLNPLRSRGVPHCHRRATISVLPQYTKRTNSRFGTCAYHWQTLPQRNIIPLSQLSSSTSMVQGRQGTLGCGTSHRTQCTANLIVQ
jgi:hypothetical protein